MAKAKGQGFKKALAKGGKKGGGKKGGKKGRPF